ncbi:MAG: hypothetical protein DMG49_22335 [Acidobacteria bacterium]|nr:MAG: hypothetical protein DMG49_22335 [Acidobacteriota bacterium]
MVFRAAARRKEAGGPRQRNSRTQVEAGTGYKITGPFRASSIRVRIDPGQIGSHQGDVFFLRFSVFCPKGMR